jgi:hypothetical protein
MSFYNGLLFYPEDGITRFHQNVSTYLPNYTALFQIVTTVLFTYLFNRTGILYLFRLLFIFIPACNCEDTGSIGVSCDSEGRCQCKDNFDGNRCEKCKEGFYNYPICEGSIFCDAMMVLNMLVVM